MSEFMTRLLSSFEDPTGLERPEMRDSSRYQYYYDHDVGAAHGVEGLFVRCGISYGYHDPFFKVNYGGAKGKMYRSSYHVLYPTQSIVKQADQVWYDEHPVLDILPRCMDAELQHDATDLEVGDAMWEMSELVLSRDGHRPLIYSRYKLLERWCRNWTPEMLNAHYYVLAQYRWARWIEHAGPPTIPKYPYNGYLPVGTEMFKRSRIVLHQTADKKAPYPGETPTPGAAKSIDRLRWELGTTYDMHKFIDFTWGEGTTPLPPPAPSDEVKVNTTALNVRGGPGIEHSIKGSFKYGMVLTVQERDGSWIKVGELKDSWIHGGYVEEL
jgi:hypothetical protein